MLDENKLIAYPVVMLLFLLLSLFFGWIDHKLGMRREELRNYATSNPILMEILERVNELGNQEKSDNQHRI